MISLSELRSVVLGLKQHALAILNDEWVCFVHPSAEADIRMVHAKGQWRSAYRSWREAGKPPLSAQQIFDRYKSIDDFNYEATGLTTAETVWTPPGTSVKNLTHTSS